MHKSRELFSLELKLISIALFIPRRKFMSNLHSLITGCQRKKIYTFHSSKLDILNVILLRRQKKTRDYFEHVGKTLVQYSSGCPS